MAVAPSSPSGCITASRWLITLLTTFSGSLVFILILVELHRKKHRVFPENMPLIFSTLALLFNLSLGIGPVSGYHQVENFHTLESVWDRNSEVSGGDRFWTHVCLVQAFLYQITGMAMIVWYILLTHILHLVIVKRVKVSSLSSKKRYYAIAVCLPLTSGAIGLAFNIYGPRSGSVECWINPPVYQFFMIYMWVCIAAVFGVVRGYDIIGILWRTSYKTQVHQRRMKEGSSIQVDLGGSGTGSMSRVSGVSVVGSLRDVTSNNNGISLNTPTKTSNANDRDSRGPGRPKVSTLDGLNSELRKVSSYSNPAPIRMTSQSYLAHEKKQYKLLYTLKETLLRQVSFVVFYLIFAVINIIYFIYSYILSEQQDNASTYFLDSGQWNDTNQKNEPCTLTILYAINTSCIGTYVALTFGLTRENVKLYYKTKRKFVKDFTFWWSGKKSIEKRERASTARRAEEGDVTRGTDGEGGSGSAAKNEEDERREREGNGFSDDYGEEDDEDSEDYCDDEDEDEEEYGINGDGEYDEEAGERSTKKKIRKSAVSPDDINDNNGNNGNNGNGNNDRNMGIDTDALKIALAMSAPKLPSNNQQSQPSSASKSASKKKQNIITTTHLGTQIPLSLQTPIVSPPFNCLSHFSLNAVSGMSVPPQNHPMTSKLEEMRIKYTVGVLNYVNERINALQDERDRANADKDEVEREQNAVKDADAAKSGGLAIEDIKTFMSGIEDESYLMFDADSIFESTSKYNDDYSTYEDMASEYENVDVEEVVELDERLRRAKERFEGLVQQKAEKEGKSSGKK